MFACQVHILSLLEMRQLRFLHPLHPLPPRQTSAAHLPTYLLTQLPSWASPVALFKWNIF